jgi:hypothetical protein
MSNVRSLHNCKEPPKSERPLFLTVLSLSSHEHLEAVDIQPLLSCTEDA